MKYIIFIFLFFLLATPVYARVKRFSTINTTTKKYTVHVGSYSIDRNNLTYEEIDKMVSAISKDIPNANYIAIGIYLDYPDQIRMWAQSIHSHGKKLYLRSAGFNNWQGTNGVVADGTPQNHITRMGLFLQSNYDIFQGGDIFEPVPDEPENGKYFQTHSLSDPNNVLEYNNFIRDAKYEADKTLFSLGVQTGYVWTNPSATHDILSQLTVDQLSSLNTDDYPEIQNGIPVQTATEAATLMGQEIDTWILSKWNKPRQITFGPSVYTQLSEYYQADFYQHELGVIFEKIKNLDGVTVWQAGANNNPKSRLFDYSNGNWYPRYATKIINRFFAK